jgi:hypothetical protein
MFPLDTAAWRPRSLWPRSTGVYPDTILFEGAVQRFRFEEVHGPESVKPGIYLLSISSSRIIWVHVASMLDCAGSAVEGPPRRGLCEARDHGVRVACSGGQRSVLWSIDSTRAVRRRIGPGWDHTGRPAESHKRAQFVAPRHHRAPCRSPLNVRWLPAADVYWVVAWWVVAACWSKVSITSSRLRFLVSGM